MDSTSNNHLAAWDRARKKNELTAAQRELIELLAEEAGEVVHIAMKLLRHGPSNFNPDGFITRSNHELLTREIGDFLAAVELLEHYCITPNGRNDDRFAARDGKLKRVGQYLHHAQVPPHLLQPVSDTVLDDIIAKRGYTPTIVRNLTAQYLKLTLYAAELEEALGYLQAGTGGSPDQNFDLTAEEIAENARAAIREHVCLRQKRKTHIANGGADK